MPDPWREAGILSSSSLPHWLKGAPSGIDSSELPAHLYLGWESYRGLEQAPRKNNTEKHGTHSRWDVFGGLGSVPHSKSWNQRQVQRMRCKAAKASPVVPNHSCECDATSKWPGISKIDDAVRTLWFGCINCAVYYLHGLRCSPNKRYFPAC